MGEVIVLTAGDGHVLSAYKAEPPGLPRGGVVVVQEIFGVNQHIRDIADRFAAEGYRTLAPALFDRVAKNVELGYEEPDLGKAFALRRAVPFESALLDVGVAVTALESSGRVGLVGYCWGGTVGWLAAARVGGLSAVSAYYGGGIGQFANEHPHCPVQLHFAERDKHLPLTEVAALRTAQPSVEVYTYPAGHGFNCDARESYDPRAAKLARERTLALFSAKIG